MNKASGNTINRFLYGKVTYNQDGLATTHNADFMHDPRFVAAYEGIAVPLPDLWYFQLYRGLGALLWVEFYGDSPAESSAAGRTGRP